MPSFRFFLQLGLVTLLLCTGYSALVLYHATLADILVLDHITQHLDWHIRPVQEVELQGVFLALSVLSTLTGLGIVLVGSQKATRHEWALLWWGIRQATASLFARFQTLPRQQRQFFWLLFGLLTILRAYFSLTKPPHGEELASYEFFVRPGLLATSAYYPVPNNHILSNTISGWLYLVKSDFWWCMRLPVLLISTLGTLGLFMLLLRAANLRIASLATFLFSMLQLSLVNASAARGYWLLITLAGLVFFSTLALSNGQKTRAAWAVLLVSSILGCYTIPTFAYVLASAFSWLGLVILRQKRWTELGQVIAIGIIVLAGVVALYAPLLLVSGFRVLVGNGFVAPRDPAEFWSELPANLWFTEGLLVGQRSIGAVLTIVVLLTFAGLLRSHSLPADIQQLFHRLGRPALWFVLLPYSLMLLQRVLPPERVFLYKAFFLFIVAALLIDCWLRRPRRPAAARWSRLTLIGGILTFALYQTYTVERYNRMARPADAAYQAAFRWLQAQPPGPILAHQPLQNLYFRYLGHTLTPGRAWRIDAQPQPAIQYAYALALPHQRAYFQAIYSAPPIFHNAEVEIYQLPAQP